MHASLALNAILYGILEISKFPDTKWALTIKYRMKTESQFNGLDVSNPTDAIRIAQILLGDPYYRMFNDINSIIE